MDDLEKFGSQDVTNPEQFSEQTYGFDFNGQNPNAFKEKKEKVKKEPKYITRKAFVITLIVCILCTAFVGTGSFFLAASIFSRTAVVNQGNGVGNILNTTNFDLAHATGSELSIQEIIAKNQNSVVAITTEKMTTDGWFGQYVTTGAGSGVVYSEDGYIMTNNHVISGANSIKVTMYDGKTYDASLVATDSQLDVAVIKIDATGLSPITFADMSTACVGDMVVAIGNPLGTLAGTATEGIISALEREIKVEGKLMTLIQTSASVNPGNSGGGLFDQYGNLIGLVVAKSSGSSIEGLGFAIPCNKVEAAVKSLIENGYVAGRPAAGITVVDLTDPQTAMKYGVSLAGVYISEVPGENAKKAGLQSGDLVYYIDDTKITSSQAVVNEIQKHNIGDEVVFTIVRGNDIIKIPVVLQDAQEIKASQTTNN